MTVPAGGPTGAVEVATAVVTSTFQARGVERVRVALRCPALPCGVFVDEHLRVALPAPGAWAGLGDVLHEESTAPPRTERLAARHPGALVVAVHRGRACRLRLGPSGTYLELRAVRRVQPPTPWPVWASLAHAFITAGLSAGAPGEVRVLDTGSRRTLLGRRGKRGRTGESRLRVR